MGEIARTAVSLRFFGDDLDPEVISATLGATPTLFGRKGSIWVGPRSGQSRILRTGRWLLRVSRRAPGNLDGQIAELLSPLKTDLAAWRELATRFRGDIFCGLFMEEENEGLALRPETLVMIGARGLTLDLDIYAILEETNLFLEGRNNET